MGASRKRPRTEPPGAERPSNAQQAGPGTEPPPPIATDGSSSSSKAEAVAPTPLKDAKIERGSDQEVRCRIVFLWS